MTKKVLVVGAGFAGAVAARILAENGVEIIVIDKRPHVGGNAYDEFDNGVRIHVYGPHLFHTNNEKVVAFLSRFTEWIDYRHKVVVRSPSGALLPMPINLDTLQHFSDKLLTTEEDVHLLLRRMRHPISKPSNAADYLYAQLGRDLTDIFFRPYSEKMWGMALEDIDTSVVKRIPIRYDRVDQYFPNDAFQLLPKNGYTELFRRMLEHKRISVQLNTAFDRSMEAGVCHIFNSMPIDEYFDSEFGELPYRSIKFHHRYATPMETKFVTINYSDHSPYTRETHWYNLPDHQRQPDARIWTVEEPCSYRDNNYERYYPVRDAKGHYAAIYRKYKESSAQLQKVSFIGRCGTYQYLNMDQVVNQQIQEMVRLGYSICYE